MVDQQLWKAKKLLTASDIRFLPAINEELGGTAVLGADRTRQLDADVGIFGERNRLINRRRDIA